MLTFLLQALWAGVVEYDNCISAEGYNSPTNECPVYDTKSFDDEALDLELWEMWSTPSLPFLPVHSDPEW